MIPESNNLRQDGPMYLPQLRPGIYVLAYDQPAWQCAGTEDLLSAYTTLRPMQVTLADWHYGRMVMN